MKRSSEQILTEWLVINCQMGDVVAMQKLLKIWYPKLLRYAFRQIGEQQKSEDAVQNALEVMTSKLSKLKDSAAFPKWIYQILHHKCADIIRQNQRQKNIVNSYQKFVESENEYRLNSKNEDGLCFDGMVRNLPNEIYQLVHLYYLEGLSVVEIQQVLDIPLGTVKSRLYHARNLIRHNLTGD
ncbi:sigma-70 family RNA polymerase sigma factor [uncultured Paraglaciecola sp.]|uniref:RNA polymerase sigma factor n=1 Tax=uncultured Paraglaciecola sp. TaxID=1765024 RepID=UPI0025989173|nr:sigma-70 family RNA polymerase sigma factor [uncultured Paraglaciecola sp.]